METLDTSDRELVEQLRSGSAQALGELFDRYADRIYTYCFRRTASWAVAARGPGPPAAPG